ncbi:hypothetical protein ABPG75_008803 [Micractinium tetrahymenae]
MESLPDEQLALVLACVLYVAPEAGVYVPFVCKRWWGLTACRDYVALTAAMDRARAARTAARLAAAAPLLARYGAELEPPNLYRDLLCRQYHPFSDAAVVQQLPMEFLREGRLPDLIDDLQSMPRSSAGFVLHGRVREAVQRFHELASQQAPLAYYADDHQAAGQLREMVLLPSETLRALVHLCQIYRARHPIQAANPAFQPLAPAAQH